MSRLKKGSSYVMMGYKGDGVPRSFTVDELYRDRIVVKDNVRGEYRSYKRSGMGRVLAVKQG